MFLVAERPSFWLEFGVRLGQALLPRALKYLTRRMPPEEAAWRQAERRGRGMSGRKSGDLDDEVLKSSATGGDM